MSSGLTLYTSRKVLDLLWGQQAITPPATWYLALLSTPASALGGGIELSGSGYARIAMANTLANFPATGVDGLKTNANLIQSAIASADWETVEGVAFMDSATAGNMWSMALINVTDQQTVPSGERWELEAGKMKVYLA